LGNNVTLAATNLFKICNVHAGVGEELRQEISELRSKYSSLAAAFGGEVKRISSNMNKIATEFKPTNSNATWAVKPG